MDNPVLVEALRGDTVESRHRGAIAVVDGDAGVHAAIGDIERPVFPRSAVKLLQALSLVASGATGALALNDEELAIACASHNGEPAHVRTAAAMLACARSRGNSSGLLSVRVMHGWATDADLELGLRSCLVVIRVPPDGSPGLVAT